MVNIIAPGVGTIISAFLGSECQSITVWMGIGQILTTPIFGLGLIWAIIWSIKMYKACDDTPGDEENPLISKADDAADVVE